MARKGGKLFSSGSRRFGRRDYRNASIGPNMGGYDAKGNTHTARSVRKTKAAHASDGTRRRNHVYTPGEISHVNPQTASRETMADFSRRRQRKARSLQPRREIPLRPVLMVLLLAVLAVAVAAGVASCVFQGSVNSRLALDDASVADALVAPENDDDPFYLLVAGTFHDAAQPDDGPDVLMLVRVDGVAPMATVVSIPSNLVWALPDGSSNYIGRAANVAGDGGLAQSVSSLAGVDIAHFAKIDAVGFVAMVDALGGIELSLPEEVDDPEAGSIYLPAGLQTLDGEQALTACRAKNYLGSYDTRAQNQMNVLVALVQKAASAEGLGSQQSTIDAIAGHFQTDLSAGDLSRLLGQFAGADASAVKMARVPGYSGYESGELQYSIAPNAWKNMMEKVDAGADPNEKTASQAITPGNYTLTVKNGSGVAGAATQVADVLEGAGYKVEDTGNTDQFAYGETLAIYKDDKDAAAAEAIIETLGVGRVVEAGIYYSFDTDLQVVVGQDWKPR